MKNGYAIFRSPFDYLDPRNHVTDLIELQILPKFLKGKVRIFVKMAPFGNIKMIPAYYMLEMARQKGLLNDVHTIIEASSGNMAAALCVLAPHFGVKNFQAVIANDTAQGKQLELNMLGAQIKLANTLPQVSRKKKMSAIKYARKMGREEKGFLNLWQYGNAKNPEAYEKWFAPQIYTQLDQLGLTERPFIFCAAMGTCGTITGCGRFFKQNHPHCHIVGVRLLPGEMVPGVRDEARLKEVKIPWKKMVDKKHLVEIGRDESYHRCMQLSQVGIMAGPSTGLALAGLLRWLEKNWKNEEAIAVFPSSDSYGLYADKFSTIAQTSEFGGRIPLTK